MQIHTSLENSTGKAAFFPWATLSRVPIHNVVITISLDQLDADANTINNIAWRGTKAVLWWKRP